MNKAAQLPERKLLFPNCKTLYIKRNGSVCYDGSGRLRKL